MPPMHPRMFNPWHLFFPLLPNPLEMAILMQQAMWKEFLPRTEDNTVSQPKSDATDAMSVAKSVAA